MKNLPKEFVWRTVRAILFIAIVVILCTAVSGTGLFLASRFGLTRSKGQVPLTALSVGQEGPVKLPVRGEMTEGNGWKLRNSRDVYTLTLDGAVIDGREKGAGERPQPAIYVSGDLTIDLKAGSRNRIGSDRVGILADTGTLVIRGEGSLEIQAGETGVAGDEVELSGKDIVIEAGSRDGIGIKASSLTIDKSVGQVEVKGKSGAVIAASPEPDAPGIHVMDTVQITPRGAGIKEFKSTHTGGGESGGAKGRFNVKTFSGEGSVAYDEETGCFKGAAGEVTFMGK